MIVGESFPADSLELARIQHDQYHGGACTLAMLYSSCREPFLRAVRTIGVENELTTAVCAATTFDHRTLQVAHDTIAAWYRYKLFGSQLELPLDGEGPDYAAARWIEWWRHEIADLAGNPDWVRLVCTAAALGNTEAGYEAEDSLMDFLAERYGHDGNVWTVFFGLIPMKYYQIWREGGEAAEALAKELRKFKCRHDAGTN